ncbi:MAG: DUF1385 domain-containing protein [Anaerovoracaceae bacterium]
MDLKKIFLKDACPTSVGGQAVIEGIMMNGPKARSLAIRLPNNEIHMKTELKKKPSKWMKWPIIRGVVAFVLSLIDGMQTLMYAADVLEAYDGPGMEQYEEEKKSKFETWVENKFGERAVWNLMLAMSVIIAVLVTVGVFIIGPTLLVDLLKGFVDNVFVLNLIEGIVRIILFVLYIYFVAKLEDIKRVFQFHGAEHKCIHCFENGLDLTPENCQKFYTLHPRCGTSFLMFVMIISLVLFSFMGWPNMVLRITSRLLLIPVIAGLSYELLKWAGRSDNWLVKILSMPGLYLQKITTKEPDNDQLEVAIAAMKAVLRDEPQLGEGICDINGRIIRENEFISSRSSKDGGNPAQ